MARWRDRFWRWYILPGRRGIGAILRLFFPDYGYCRACGVPWLAINARVVPYRRARARVPVWHVVGGDDYYRRLEPGSTWQQSSSRHGCFALCRDCFAHLTVDERVRYHKELVGRWSSEAQRDWPQIEAALRANPCRD
jgi:hypothetical protein